MAKIGIFYGSTTGNTEEVGKKVQEAIGIENSELHDIASISVDELQKYDCLIFGASTWGEGDLQDDWDSFIPNLDAVSFSGKKVALFGLGDQETYPDTFVDGIGTIYKKVIEKGAVVVGFWPVDGYTFDGSTAVEGDSFVGLVIDEENQSELTDDRIKAWIEKLKDESFFSPHL